VTGWVLSLLPLALGLGMYSVSPEGISLLWKRPIGLKLLYTAVGMDILGALVIRRMKILPRSFAWKHRTIACMPPARNDGLTPPGLLR